MIRLCAALAALAALCLPAPALAGRGYLHQAQARKAIHRYAYSFGEHTPMQMGECRRRAERVIDCSVFFPGQAPSGEPDPAYDTRWLFRAWMHNGKIHARWPIE